ncbi:MAG: hypothetical protein HWD61_08140 [Parachlamydiaceae bacterium]|nr:MAG: hypothetical protein HWD61_08140 [Parachlamydiaceae bacterium]
MPPIFGTQYESAERDLLELKENFPDQFAENKFYYDWLEKWGKLKTFN